MEEKTQMQISAEVKDIEHGKELLDDLKALSDKYDVSINMAVRPDRLEFYTLT